MHMHASSKANPANMPNKSKGSAAGRARRLRADPMYGLHTGLDRRPRRAVSAAGAGQHPTGGFLSARQQTRESRRRREGNKLKRLLADKTVEVDFFRNALQKVEARRQQTDICGEKASTTKFEMPLQGGLSIERMCQLAQVSRAGFYRHLDCRAPKEEDMTVRSAVQEIALEHGRYYGYRRVTAEPRRRGMMVNHNRVARIMRTDNLLTIQNGELRQVTDP